MNLNFSEKILHSSSHSAFLNCTFFFGFCTHCVTSDVRPSGQYNFTIRNQFFPTKKSIKGSAKLNIGTIFVICDLFFFCLDFLKFFGPAKFRPVRSVRFFYCCSEKNNMSHGELRVHERSKNKTQTVHGGVRLRGTENQYSAVQNTTFLSWQQFWNICSTNFV